MSTEKENVVFRPVNSQDETRSSPT